MIVAKTSKIFLEHEEDTFVVIRGIGIALFFGMSTQSGTIPTFTDGLTIPFPTMSASLPGEDLAQGTNG